MTTETPPTTARVWTLGDMADAYEAPRSLPSALEDMGASPDDARRAYHAFLDTPADEDRVRGDGGLSLAEAGAMLVALGCGYDFPLREGETHEGRHRQVAAAFGLDPAAAPEAWPACFRPATRATYKARAMAIAAEVNDAKAKAYDPGAYCPYTFGMKACVRPVGHVGPHVSRSLTQTGLGAPPPPGACPACHGNGIATKDGASVSPYEPCPSCAGMGRQAPEAPANHESCETRGDRRCRVESEDGLMCTRTRGHAGPHVAHGLGEEVVGRWQAEPTAGAPDREAGAPAKRGPRASEHARPRPATKTMNYRGSATELTFGWVKHKLPRSIEALCKPWPEGLGSGERAEPRPLGRVAGVEGTLVSLSVVGLRGLAARPEGEAYVLARPGREHPRDRVRCDASGEPWYSEVIRATLRAEGGYEVFALSAGVPLFCRKGDEIYAWSDVFPAADPEPSPAPRPPDSAVAPAREEVVVTFVLRGAQSFEAEIAGVAAAVERVGLAAMRRLFPAPPLPGGEAYPPLREGPNTLPSSWEIWRDWAGSTEVRALDPNAALRIARLCLACDRAPVATEEKARLLASCELAGLAEDLAARELLSVRDLARFEAIERAFADVAPPRGGR